MTTTADKQLDLVCWLSSDILKLTSETSNETWNNFSSTSFRWFFCGSWPDWAGACGFESLHDDTTDKRNVVQDTLEEEDDDNQIKTSLWCGG